MAEGTKQDSNTSTKNILLKPGKKKNPTLQPANNTAKEAQIADDVLFIANITVSLQPISFSQCWLQETWGHYVNQQYLANGCYILAAWL